MITLLPQLSLNKIWHPAANATAVNTLVSKSTTRVSFRTSWTTWSHVIWMTTTSCWMQTSQKMPHCTAVRINLSESSLYSCCFTLWWLRVMPADVDGISHMAQWRRRQLCWGTQDVHNDNNRWGTLLLALWSVPSWFVFTKSSLWFPQRSPELQTGLCGEQDNGCVPGHRPHPWPLSSKVILNMERHRALNTL